MCVKNILFIGGGGFIGSNVIRVFFDSPLFRVFLIEPSACSRYSDLLGARFYIGRLRDFELVRDVLVKNNIDIVVHLASTLVPSSNNIDYEFELDEIVLPSSRIINFCAKSKIKFVYFSSGGAIYGNTSSGCMAECDNLEPISYYGLSKKIVEDIVSFESRVNGLNYLILRPSNPYGPGQNLNSRQGFIGVSISKVLNDEPVVIWGDGECVRDYIYICDLAWLVFQLVSSGVDNEIINLGSGVGYSLNDVVSVIKSVSGKKVVVVYEDGRSSDVNKVILDISKLRSYCSIDFTPLVVGVKKYLNYFNGGVM